jgi:hypothetical protein
MSNVSILSGEVEIDGIKGSLLIVDEQNPDANLAEDLALIGSTVCRLRNEPTLDLRLVAN